VELRIFASTDLGMHIHFRKTNIAVESPSFNGIYMHLPRTNVGISMVMLVYWRVISLKILMGAIA